MKERVVDADGQSEHRDQVRDEEAPAPHSSEQTDDPKATPIAKIP
jgi:hypothetical protein